MVGSLYLIALATLPVYPGAVHKELAKVDRPEMKTYWVEQPTSVVVAWYERRLKRPAKRLKAEGFPTFSLALKERRLGFNGQPKSVLIKGVVVWGQEGGPPTSPWSIETSQVVLSRFRRGRGGSTMDRTQRSRRRWAQTLIVIAGARWRGARFKGARSAGDCPNALALARPVALAQCA